MKLSLHNIKSRSAVLVWLLTSMLLLFPVGLPALPGVILCLESDGRVALENSCTEEYVSNFSIVSNEMEEGTHSPETTDYSNSGSGASCVGVVLFSSHVNAQVPWTVKASIQAKKFHSVLSIQFSSMDHENVSSRTAGQINRSSERHAQVSDIASLRTVILVV